MIVGDCVRALPSIPVLYPHPSVPHSLICILQSYFDSIILSFHQIQAVVVINFPLKMFFNLIIEPFLSKQTQTKLWFISLLRGKKKKTVKVVVYRQFYGSVKQPLTISLLGLLAKIKV